MIDMLELTGSLARFREAYRDRTAMLERAHARHADALHTVAAEIRQARRALDRIHRSGDAAAAAVARLALAHSRLNDAVWVLKARLQPEEERATGRRPGGADLPDQEPGE